MGEPTPPDDTTRVLVLLGATFEIRTAEAPGGADSFGWELARAVGTILSDAGCACRPPLPYLRGYGFTASIGRPGFDWPGLGIEGFSLRIDWLPADDGVRRDDWSVGVHLIKPLGANLIPPPSVYYADVCGFVERGLAARRPTASLRWMTLAEFHVSVGARVPYRVSASPSRTRPASDRPSADAR